MRALFLILVAGCSGSKEFQEGQAVGYLGLDYTGSLYQPELAGCERTAGDAGSITAWDDEGRMTRSGDLTYVWDGPCITHAGIETAGEAGYTYDASCDEHGWPVEWTFVTFDEAGTETDRTETSAENTYQGHQLLQATASSASSSEEVVSSYTWDRNRVASVTTIYAGDPDEETQTFTWNRDGFILAETGEFGPVATYTYDNLGRLTTVILGSDLDNPYYTVGYEYADDAAEWPMLERVEFASGDGSETTLQYSCE